MDTVTSLVDDVNAMMGDDDEEAGDVTKGSGGDYRSGTDAIFGRAVAGWTLEFFSLLLVEAAFALHFLQTVTTRTSF